MTDSILRPEDRRRRHEPAWVDTAAAWYRSEAFAEDLPVTSTTASPPSLLRVVRAVLGVPAAHRV